MKGCKAFAERWLRYVDEAKKGNKPTDYNIGKPESFEELAPLLVKRAGLLLEWTQDDSFWEDE